MKKFVNFTVKTSVSASTFCHFHISVVGSYLRMCIVYKSIYSCPRRFFDVSGKKKVPPADADGTLVSGLGKMLHSHFRANALYCLLAQAKCSLMVQEKQMPLLAALVFLLDSLYLKPIPHSPDSLNILRLCCIKLDLLSYLFNMHCYSGNISNGFHIPDFGEKLFFCKYMVGILC